MIPPVRPIGVGEWAGHSPPRIAPSRVYGWSAKLTEAAGICRPCLAGVRAGTHVPLSGDHVEAWRPWPAYPPFAAEVERWWPSDEPPPLSSTGIPDEISGVERQRVLLWRGVGGFIDFLA